MLDFEGLETLFFLLDDDRHSHSGIFLLEGDDVGVVQADAAFACASWHAVLVVGAAMNANAVVAGRDKPQEPVAIGENGTSSIAKVVRPVMSWLYGIDDERLAWLALRCAHVAFFLLLSFVKTHTHGDLCNRYGIAFDGSIYSELKVFL